MYKFQVLMTGSEGNCSLLQYKDTTILIDAGFKTKTKMEELLRPIINSNKIDAILITHEHTDHFSTWTGRLSMAINIPIYLHPQHYADEETRKTKYLSHEDKKAKQTFKATVVDIKENQEFTIKDIAIKPFTAYHDAKKTLGFVFNNEFGYLADCGFISNSIKKKLLPVKYLALEFNYDINKLLTSERHWKAKWRTLSKFGHLSNDEAIKFVNFLKTYGNLQEIYTLHPSLHHNDNETIKTKILNLIEGKSISNFDFHISDRENNKMLSIG